MKKSVRFLLVLVLNAGVLASSAVWPTEAVAEQQSATATSPPEDPLFPQDISAWTYTPEFAERFKRLKLKEPGPTGAYAVNFQVQQVEELDRCVFNVFLDNKLPIDYPEGPVGFLPFTYPMSWAFLKLPPEDQQAVDVAYLSKYRAQRAVLRNGSIEHPLTLFQYRTNLYSGVAVITLALSCDRVTALKNPLRIQLRTTAGKPHEVILPEHFLSWIEATLRKWRRPEAKLEQGLADRNVWSYTPEFAKRFGLPSLSDSPPTGAQAVAFRVERYHMENHACMLDIYVDESVPVRLPEGESGFLSLHPALGYFLVPKDRNEPHTRPPYVSKIFDTELFAIWDLRTDRERKKHPDKQHLGGDRFRVTTYSPLSFNQYRKHTVPGGSYLSLRVICSIPSPHDGPVGVSFVKTDGTKHEIMFSVPFLEGVRRQMKERVELPFKCKYPKLYPQEPCEGRVPDKR